MAAPPLASRSPPWGTWVASADPGWAPQRTLQLLPLLGEDAF